MICCRVLYVSVITPIFFSTSLAPHSHMSGRTTQILSNLSLKRDWGPKRVKSVSRTPYYTWYLLWGTQVPETKRLFWSYSGTYPGIPRVNTRVPPECLYPDIPRVYIPGHPQGIKTRVPSKYVYPGTPRVHIYPGTPRVLIFSTVLDIYHSHPFMVLL